MGRVDDRRVALRGAIFDADGRRVVVALSKGPWDELLQLAGDGLIISLAQGVAGAPDLARRCVEQLRGRVWEGDDDLADQLDAALGDRPAPMLRPLPVDLEELAGILEGDPAHGGGQIDLRTGEVWPQAAIDYACEENDDDPDDEDPDRWLPVWREGSRAAYGDMEDFIEALSDRDRATVDRHLGSRGLPPLQGRPRALARRARGLVHVLRGAPTRPRHISEVSGVGTSAGTATPDPSAARSR